jgi:hypothetical protein
MKIIFTLFVSLFCLFACRNAADTFPAKSVAADSIPESGMDIDTEDAVAWLTEVIENHLNEGGYHMEDICTSRYYEYKMDAVQVGYDGGLTEAEFKKKWSADYNMKYAGIGTGFLISGQDWGNVKVTKCTPKSDGKNGFLLLNVTIRDIEFNVSYHRDIKIVPIGKAYQIDDVVEYD